MVTIAVGNIKSQLRFGDDVPTDVRASIAKLVRGNLKYPNDYWVRRASGFRIPEYTTMLMSQNTFYTGLLPYVVHMFRENDIEYRVEDCQTQIETPSAERITQRIERLSLTPRPYQMDAIFKGLEKKRGMFDLPTGSGKSFIMAAITSVWQSNALVVCDSVDLARQLQEEFDQILGEKVGLVGAGEFDVQRVTIGIVSTLANKKSGKKKKKKIKEFLDTRNHILFDEVHHSQARTWQQVAKMCKNVVLRHGFSGTCFSSETLDSDGNRVPGKNIQLIAHTGPIVFKMKTQELIDLGYLSRPIIWMISNTLYFSGQTLNTADEYTRTIVEDEKRNKVAAKVVNSTVQEGEQAICFVERINHGEEFVKELTKMGVESGDVEYVTGQDNLAERKEIISDFKEKDLPVLVGTVLGEGLNFFARDGINLAAGRSKKNTIQRLGRVLRKNIDPEIGDVNPDEERVVNYYDFCDKGHPWYSKQAKARVKTYLDEGHEVRFIQFINGQKVKGSMGSLKIKGKKLSTIYSAWKDVYHNIGKWKWKTGEKPRVKQTFVYLAEALGVRDNEEFDNAIEHFKSYLEEQQQDWLEWDKSDRNNWIGFVLNSEKIELYAAKQRKSSNSEIAGTATNDDWDF